MSSLNTMSKNSQSRTTLDGRTWDVHSHSSSTLPRSHRPTPTRPTPTPRSVPAPSSAPIRGSKTRLSIVSGTASNRSSSVERSNQNNPYMVQNGFQNRDAPKFEKRERDMNSRFFGSGGPAASEDDSEVVERSRPPPDMRRYLLDNVNRSRSTTTAAKQPSVINAF